MNAISNGSLQSPSLSNEEKENNGRTEITKTSVNEFHEEQLLDGGNNNHNTMKLVNILGGIDKILSNYLSESNNLTLTNHELQQIYQIITTPQKYQQTTKHEPLTILNHSNTGHINMEENDNNHNKKFYYSFNKSNTYLVSIFGIETATKISKIMYSTPTIVILICSMIIYYITQALWWDIYLIVRLFVVFIWIPVAIFLIFVINREIFKIIIHSFELWFKLCYAFLFVLFRSINGWDRIDFKFDIILHILILALIFIVSSFDALNIRRSAKILLSSIAAVIFSFFSILYQLSLNGYEDYIIHITSNYPISTLSIMASTSRVLAIFLWRQSILTICRKDRFILIRYSPYIKWNESINKVDITTDNNPLIISNGQSPLKQTSTDVNQNDLQELTEFIHINEKRSMSSDDDVNDGKEHKNKEINNNQQASSDNIHPVNKDRYHNQPDRNEPDRNGLRETKCTESDCEFEDADTIPTNQLNASLLSSEHRQHIQQCHRKLYQRLQDILNDEEIQLEVNKNNQMDLSHTNV